MTIEHYRFRPGTRLDTREDPHTQLQRTMDANPQLKTVLQAGEYDVTPDVWTKYGSNRYTYNLTVHEDGTGTMRLTPVHKDRNAAVVSPGSFEFKPDGKTIQIPQESPTLPIAGPTRGDPSIRVFDIVTFVPGPSPKPKSPQS